MLYKIHNSNFCQYNRNSVKARNIGLDLFSSRIYNSLFKFIRNAVKSHIYFQNWIIKKFNLK